MTVEKVVENGMTYRVETTENSVVKMLMSPELRYESAPESVTVGTVVNIPMRLEDFDGEARDETRNLTFIVDGEPVELPLVNGALALELELAARGRQRIALMTDTITMKPIEIEVVMKIRSEVKASGNRITVKPKHHDAGARAFGLAQKITDGKKLTDDERDLLLVAIAQALGVRA